jgi:carboxynorspermidine decarboxylase
MTPRAPLPVRTPAFVYDEACLAARAAHLERVSEQVGCVPLYALKPFSFVGAMEVIAPHVAGFSASSLFEARLARGVLGDRGQVHVTTPGFRPDEVDELAELCDHVVFNSLGQWERLAPIVGERAALGLRVNPQLPFIADDRYNPCRRHSKLGVPLPALEALLAEAPGGLEGLRGLHFHTNCDCDDFRPLLQTVGRVAERLGPLLARARWVNLGGGYLLGAGADLAPLAEAVGLLRGQFGVEVLVEPGAALARPSASIVAAVVDLFPSDGATVAVLDTTVNHMPEYFEYQEAPEVAGSTPGGAHRYLLAGCTCLAGDVLGEHAFEAPLAVGSQVVFPNLGAYTMVKWSWFNGVNIPTVYARTPDGRYVLESHCEFAEFATRCGGR